MKEEITLQTIIDAIDDLGEDLKFQTDRLEKAFESLERRLDEFEYSISSKLQKMARRLERIQKAF
jgi:chaperonin cofactor prefoldin